jgi:hypothetical protein
MTDAKVFSLEFLVFPGLDVQCELCREPIQERQEEIVAPVLYLDKEYQGPICSECYKNLPDRINAAYLPKFQG